MPARMPWRCTCRSKSRRPHEKAYKQVCGYMDRLGVPEGWLVVFDPDFTKPWGGRISSEDIPFDGKTIHLVRC